MKYILFFSLFILSACSTTYQNQEVVGKRFPHVQGKSLEGKTWKIPEEMEAKRTVLLVGYKQKSQFDIDRWLLGLDFYQVKAPIFEIPAIQGFIPRLIKDKIDSGMRSGIPNELWKIVITVYKDGARIQEFTGNENPNNARVLVIDSGGKILYFHDRGFSVNDLKLMLKTLR